MRAKKSFGQHFLIDDNLCSQIATRASQYDNCDLILEIGPGKGALTKHLISLELPLYAVEADKDMVQHLNKIFPQWDNLLLMDFLKMPLDTLFEKKRIALVGNFPYNISSQIVFKMLDYKEQIPVLIGMFQREMARRIIASPGSKEYGVISVLTQLFYSGQMLFKVPPEAFRPPPKVHSGVILLERNNRTELPCSYPLFKQIVKNTFNQRRKMLRNTLKSILPHPELLPATLLTRRPEQLSVQEFLDLAARIQDIIR